MRRRAQRKSDFGTIVLHWSLVVTLVVLVTTGLRIAADSPYHKWLLMFDWMLPKQIVWTGHMPAAIALVGLAFAYVAYMSSAGLGGRVRLDRARLMGLLGGNRARWGALNVILSWGLFATLLVEIATGALMYFGYAGGGGAIIDVHRFCTWILLGLAFAHLVAEWLLGGWSQLLRIFRPTALAAPPPPFDPLEILTLLDWPSGQMAPPPDFGSRKEMPTVSSERARRRGGVVQANPYMVAIAAGVAGVTFAYTIDNNVREYLTIRRVPHAEAPIIDGDVSDPVWRTTKPVAVLTQQGANFDGTGETHVEIRAVHDGEWAYFSFIWDDPTRSLKHLPLVKKVDGWHLLQHGYDRGSADAFFEDKFAVLLTNLDITLAGDRTFHAGPVPIAGRPPTLSRRGLHFAPPGAVVEIWQWKATSGGRLGYMDHSHFGPPAEPTQAEIEGRSPYRGGFAPDPGSAPYSDNFDPRGPGGYDSPITPRRLPRDLAKTHAGLGGVDLDPNHGEADGSRWWMTTEESVPYSPDFDAKIPVGSVIPGVIMSGSFTGDRASVRCASRWSAGRWSLEAARRLGAQSPYEVGIATGTYMRVAAFDHSQIDHTRHVKPIRLEVE